MNIKILGTGCANCKRTEAAAIVALQQLDMQVSVEKVEDIIEIMQYDVMSTPAVVIDEVVKISGRVPSVEELKELFKSNAAKDCCDDPNCCKEDEKCNCSESENHQNNPCC